MRLQDILHVDRVDVQLNAADKGQALRALAELFVRADDDLDADAIVRVFEEREALASTGVGSGVAIPHGRLPDVTTLRAALGVSPEGVPFDAIDGRPARILVAVLAPNRQTGDHLKALARFSRVLRDEETRERLLEAADAQEAVDVLIGSDHGR
ncbi:MAG: PTS sugar transporter subunit IIA [Sandaracinaceae bacterium]